MGKIKEFIDFKMFLVTIIPAYALLFLIFLLITKNVSESVLMASFLIIAWITTSFLYGLLEYVLQASYKRTAKKRLKDGYGSQDFVEGLAVKGVSYDIAEGLLSYLHNISRVAHYPFLPSDPIRSELTGIQRYEIDLITEVLCAKFNLICPPDINKKVCKIKSIEDMALYLSRLPDKSGEVEG